MRNNENLHVKHIYPSVHSLCQIRLQVLFEARNTQKQMMD